MRRLPKGLFSLLICVGLVLESAVWGAAQIEVYRSAPNENGRIALTFDDGPHPRQTHRILEILDRYGVHATFFMIGVNVKNYPDAAREVVSRGHEVGNHTYTHGGVDGLREEALSEELLSCEEILWQICAYRPRLFRPPRGVLGDNVEHCSARGGYRIVLWSLDTRDWESKNAQAIASCVLQDIRPGDIVLMHDYVANGKTPEALEILLPQLLALGYEPVTVGELLGVA